MDRQWSRSKSPRVSDVFLPFHRLSSRSWGRRKSRKCFPRQSAARNALPPLRCRPDPLDNRPSPRRVLPSCADSRCSDRPPRPGRVRAVSRTIARTDTLLSSMPPMGPVEFVPHLRVAASGHRIRPELCPRMRITVTHRYRNFRFEFLRKIRKLGMLRKRGRP
jgi:hypothetical protein